ncbi:flavin reductase family protein [Winslowiella iniecta]|uniref:Flavin reductase n=1 Tax=Winslowiella iniecta TaxID=1560201 RepID=A0A0L7T4K0_9GAMM|nr:flavin reductase family protein [Winslowiella iniecta]KOC90283.1 flavin reductase [Winslowiella iniecta]KOC94755.1 flavin reductase [Winslowiella iniecta]
MDADKRRQLRDAFGAFMTGVTVVTTNDRHGNPIGFTANSFSSVSLDPALLLVSIDKRSANFDNFTGCKHFAINILAEQQKETSNIFAQKIEDRFALINWRKAASGVPLIDDSSAWFDCAMHQVIDAGDHAILIGQVGEFESCGTAGLGYYRGAYFTPYQNAESLISSPNVVVSALIEFDGQALMVNKDGGYSLPSRHVSKSSVSETLALLINDLHIAASPGFVYSIYEDRHKNQQHIVFLCAQPTGSDLSPPPVHQAQWYNLNNLSELPIADSALKSLMNRFVRENAVGNYALYYGDDCQGSIKHFALQASEEAI